jgi:hypothetical protein
VRLDPGNHFAQTDSLGWFQFADVPHGRYRVVVQTIGFVEASDSVTYGGHGVEILVALAPYEPGLLECVRSLRDRVAQHTENHGDPDGECLAEVS